MLRKNGPSFNDRPFYISVLYHSLKSGIISLNPLGIVLATEILCLAHFPTNVLVSSWKSPPPLKHPSQVNKGSGWIMKGCSTPVFGTVQISLTGHFSLSTNSLVVWFKINLYLDLFVPFGLIFALSSQRKYRFVSTSLPVSSFVVNSCSPSA